MLNIAELPNTIYFDNTTKLYYNVDKVPGKISPILISQLVRYYKFDTENRHGTTYVINERGAIARAKQSIRKKKLNESN